MRRSAVLMAAFWIVAASCRDSTGPNCGNPFTGTLDSSTVPQAGLWGCARFYEEAVSHRWIIELREDETLGESLNVIYNSARPAVGTFQIASNDAFVVTIGIRTATNSRSFTATSGSLTIVEAGDRVRGTVVFTAKETTQGAAGTATVNVAAKFTATCEPAPFQTC